MADKMANYPAGSTGLTMESRKPGRESKTCSLPAGIGGRGPPNSITRGVALTVIRPGVDPASPGALTASLGPVCGSTLHGPGATFPAARGCVCVPASVCHKAVSLMSSPGPIFSALMSGLTAHGDVPSGFSGGKWFPMGQARTKGTCALVGADGQKRGLRAG